MQKGRMKGNAGRGNQIAFGSFAIKALEECWITSRQIEASRIAATRYMKREGQMWIRIFPDKPITKKPAEVRMGKGKGAPEYWAAVVKPGRIMFELDGVPLDIAREALRLAAQKLPITTILYALGFTKEKIIETFYTTNNYSYDINKKYWVTDFNPENYKRPIKISYDLIDSVNGKKILSKGEKLNIVIARKLQEKD